MTCRMMTWLAATFWCIGFAVVQNAASESVWTDEQIVNSFSDASGGYSTDEVMIRDDLRVAFFDRLSETVNTPLSPEQKTEAVLSLLKLRKAGKLTVAATRRGESIVDDVGPVAEIAARVVADRHRISTDRMLADEDLRKELQHEAELIRPGIDAYAVRRTVLGLRKKRQLKPELVLQVADWDRKIETYTLKQLSDELVGGSISTGPGVYLFRVPSGYLYVGEAANLATRLSQHVGGSDRVSLADYLAGDQADQVTVELHIFPSDSPARRVTVRRAYESELIRSRDPKFNVRP